MQIEVSKQLFDHISVNEYIFILIMPIEQVQVEAAHSLIFQLCVGQPSQVLPVVKNLPAHIKVQETFDLFLGWEDPQEKEMATRPSILTWKIPWTQEPGGLQSMGLQRVYCSYMGGTPLEYRVSIPLLHP